MDVRIALAGNPNSGKTTLFNALTGSNQFVGNWPGVTVEKKEGKLKKHEGVTITDLPGIYSLSPYTLEEVVARNYLLGERPDAILNIIDGTNLERNLYLTTQLTELGIPVVVAINMMDLVKKLANAWLSVMTRRGFLPRDESVSFNSVSRVTIEIAPASSTSRMVCCCGRIRRPFGAAESIGTTRTTKSFGFKRSRTRYLS